MYHTLKERLEHAHRGAKAVGYPDKENTIYSEALKELERLWRMEKLLKLINQPISLYDNWERVTAKGIIERHDYARQLLEMLK